MNKIANSLKRRFTITLCLFFIYTQKALAAKLDNPLGTTDVSVVIGRLLQAILGVTGSIALLMFVYGGFLWLISAGEKEKVKKGQEVMKWAILGLVVIVTAYVIVSTIVSALESGTLG